jgi:GH25 family lysozyme M1 (1,4-beta-N-acetylmuramidase)
MPDTHLPDVSEFQPNVTWPQVVAHNGGAGIVRAHNGYRTDNCWYGGARRTAAEQAGCRVLGFYAYLPKEIDPVTSARALASVVGSLKPGQFAILDLEEGTGDQDPRAVAWLNECDRLLTYPGYHGAWLYSGDNFYHVDNLMPIANSNRHTWVAAYGQGEPNDVPHTLWQHSSSEAWPGIGACDCSIFHGDVAALEAKVWTNPRGVSHPPAPVPKPIVHTTPAPVAPAYRPPVPPPAPSASGEARLIRVPGTAAVFATDGQTRTWVESQDALRALIATGIYGPSPAIYPIDAAALAAIPLTGPAPQ